MHKKLCFISTLIVALALLGFGGQTWAGGPENPPASGTIVGPELWGEMIIDCSAANIATLRVKRIVDCEVETQAFIDTDYGLGCPADETTPVYRKLDVTLFDINPDPTVMNPIITKVKNYKQEAAPSDSIFSFDVQIKFWTP